MQTLDAQQDPAKGARIRISVCLDARRELSQGVERALHRPRVVLAIRGHEVRLRREPMGSAERLLAAHAETDRRWARVEH